MFKAILHSHIDEMGQMPALFNKKSTKRVGDARWNLMSRGDMDERVNVFFSCNNLHISHITCSHHKKMHKPNQTYGRNIVSYICWPISGQIRFFFPLHVYPNTTTNPDSIRDKNAIPTKCFQAFLSVESHSFNLAIATGAAGAVAVAMFIYNDFRHKLRPKCKWRSAFQVVSFFQYFFSLSRSSLDTISHYWINRPFRMTKMNCEKNERSDMLCCRRTNQYKTQSRICKQTVNSNV